MGVPSVFIRTSGCNLRCSWCDTPYTSWQPEGTELELDQILDEVEAHPARHVVVTGGEPMIAPEIVALTERLRALRDAHHHRDGGHGVRAGGLRPDEHQPEAGQFHAGRAGGRRSTNGCASSPRCCAELMARYEYQLKFVIARPGDLDEVRVAGGDAGRGARACDPDARGHGAASGCASAAVWLAEICKQEGFRFSPRLHVDLWGARRGV